MFDFIAGLRYAVRSLRQTPAFALLAITILAAGIGSTAVMYTLVRAVLLRELPFRDPGRLVWMYNLRTERDRAPLSLPDLDDYRREGTTLAGLAAFTNWTTNITGAGEPERLDGVRVSGEFFPLIGTEALLGRVLQPEDQNRDARVTVITHGLWQRRFGADPVIVGRSVSLNGTAYTIVGVLRTRRRELAIRTALGATRRDLIIVMLRGEMRPVLVGLAAGLASAGILAPLLFAAAFAISPHDAATYVEVSMLLFAVAIVATYVPVRRAGAADPTEALHV